MKHYFVNYVTKTAVEAADQCVKTKSHLGKLKLGIWFFSLAFLSTVSDSAAQTESSIANRWGAEISGIGIGVFSLYQGKVTYLLNPSSKLRSEVGLGFLIQPESNRSTNNGFNANGIYSANQVSLAYRLYVWKGLHLENVANAGSARVRNSVVDGNDYQSFVVFNQTFVGYKFNLFSGNRTNIFLIGQAGVGSVPYSRSPWPTRGDRSSFYGLGDLKVGVNF